MSAVFRSPGLLRPGPSTASSPVTLLLGFHAHQPVGNFPWVIEDAVRRCYRPFLKIAERHPAVKFSLHISGWLLGVLAKKHPAEISRIKRMIARGQVEMIGGGDTEPVLAAIPEIDRREQLAAMAARLRRTFGVKARGVWLTERVWEPTVVPALAASGARFTAVDDYHFMAAGRDPEELNGYFTTEEAGQRLDLFPISQALRYAIPFKSAKSVITALEAMPPGACAIYFDDLEKFGIWPATYAAVYRKGWLEAFFAALQASPKLTTATFGEFHRRNPSRGLVYVPTTSYFEMNAWTLPTPGARRLEQLARDAIRAGRLEQDKAHLRGGIWKNFLTKYPEANWMHKRVEQASLRFHRLPRAEQSPAMRDSLHRAQANDAYWHGLFGGVYLPFLRRSVYAGLADLEARLDALQPRPPVEQRDIDLDGRREVALRGGKLFAVVRPPAGGELCELTDYSFHHNFADVLARREEAYHAKARRRARRSRKFARAGASPLRSIHERALFKPRFKASDLEFDRGPRGLFVDMWQRADGIREPLSYLCSGRIHSTVHDVPRTTLVAQSGELEVVKDYRIARNAIEVTYTLTAQRESRGEFSIRLDVAMPSADGPRGCFVVDGKRRPGRLAATLSARDVQRVSLRDSVLPGSLDLQISSPCRLRTSPLRTVSRSEFGFEKIMQASTLTLAWPIALDEGKKLELRLRLHPVKARPSSRPRAGAQAARDKGTS